MSFEGMEHVWLRRRMTLTDVGGGAGLYGTVRYGTHDKKVDLPTSASPSSSTVTSGGRGEYSMLGC